MNKQRFYSATDKLVNAFIMGKVNHADICSCAVGTLCNGMGTWWSENIDFIANQNLGYGITEIFEVERNFEGRELSVFGQRYIPKATINRYSDPDGFIGLCNVFDYLVSIEDWSEEESQINLVAMLTATPRANQAKN